MNIPCSPAWTVKIQNLVSDAVAVPYEELRSELASQKQLQWCWAHLKRDIQKLIDSPDNQFKRLGHDLMRQQKLLFQHWRRYQAGELKWGTFQSLVRPIREEVHCLLLRGIFSGNAKLVGFCNELYPRREHLWTFTRIEGIEPTNNTAERALYRIEIRRSPRPIAASKGSSSLIQKTREPARERLPLLVTPSKSRRIASSPFGGFGLKDVNQDRRRIARAITIDELNRLLRTARMRPIDEASDGQTWEKQRETGCRDQSKAA